MRVTLHGGTDEVTGSAYLVETQKARVLVDFGMFQGTRELEAKNRLPRGTRPKSLDAVVVTHAHLDHTGRLPLIARLGYKPPLYATEATAEMAAIIMQDSARIQERDYERQNRKRKFEGKEPLEPLYTTEDVERTLELFRPLLYEEKREIAPGVEVLLTDAGHMLGSASVKLIITENGHTKNVVFSGDLGHAGQHILRDAVPFEDADVLFMESTYGDRDHRPLGDTLIQAREIIKEAVRKGGKVLIPAFAVGRVQQLLFYLGVMFHNKTVAPFPVYVDSPMAVAATNVYIKHPDLFDEGAAQFLEGGRLPEEVRTVVACETPEESKRLNSVAGPCVIMAPSGMCNAGRIVHHLKYNLPDANTSVIIVGYQAEGSLGRRLVEGAKRVTIHGQSVEVRAQIHTLNGFSAHAGRSELLSWLGAIAKSRPKLVLTHGEPEPKRSLAQAIEEQYGMQAVVPRTGDVLEFA